MKVLDPEALKKQIDFKPHSGQLKVLANMKRFTILNCGRRWGKTMLVAYLSLKQLLLSRKNVWIVAPSYDLSKKSFTYISDWIAQYFPKGSFQVNFSTLTITGPFGSKLVCKSGENPQSLLGESLDLLIMDEASRLKKEVWESYLRPSLSDREGSMVAISTPVSRENAFYQLFLRGKDNTNKDWISYQFSSMSNPYLSEADLAEAKATLPDQVWRREYEAVFLDSAYSVFRNVRDCISPNLPREPIADHKHIIGIDLAKINDFSVVSVVDSDTNEMIYFDRFSKISYTLQKERIVNIFNKFPRAKIICDSGATGGSFIDELRLIVGQQNVEPFSFVGTISKDIAKKGSKERLVEHMSQFIESGEIRIPANEILIDELESYGVEISERGNSRYSAPQGLHDDCVMSLALAVWKLKSKERKEKAFRRKKQAIEKRIERRRRTPRGRQYI